MQYQAGFGELPHNKALQGTLDPSPIFWLSPKNVAASNAPEFKRYTA